MGCLAQVFGFTLPWFPATFYSAAIACYVVICFRRGMARPAGFTVLPTPPLRHFRAWEKEDTRIEELFLLRKDRLWFRLKKGLSGMLFSLDRLLQVHGSPLARLGKLYSELGDDFDRVMDHTRFRLVRGDVPIGGYAGKTSRKGEEFVVGLEGWVSVLPLLSSSAADHELMHCVQHACRRVFDLEWVEQGLGNRLFAHS